MQPLNRRLPHSESSCRGHTQQPERKVSVAFVDAKPPKPDEFFLPDIPFSNLLASTVDMTAKVEREAATAPSSQVNTRTME